MKLYLATRKRALQPKKRGFKWEDEDLGETILDIEVRGKRGFGYCKRLAGS